MLLNTRSLTKHAMEIRDLLHDHAPDLLFLIETWLNPALQLDIATAIPACYKIERQDWQNKPGDEVA